MNVLLDEQDWQSKDGSSIAARLPRLRMPEMPVAGAGCHISGNHQSSGGSGGGLHQATLTQASRSPPVAAATYRKKNRTSTADVESDDYTDSLSKDPNYDDANRQPGKDKKISQDIV